MFTPCYCFVCGRCLYTPQEQAAERLCWPCSVAFAGGVRLRASVTLPERPDWQDCYGTLVVSGVDEAAAARRWDGTERNVPEKRIN